MSIADKAIKALNDVAHNIPADQNAQFTTIVTALAELHRLEQESIEDSWRGSVDRMSGAFDQTEVDDREGW